MFKTMKRPQSGSRISSQHRRHTKASTLAKSHVQLKQDPKVMNTIMNPNELFKMKKFLNVAPRTDTNIGSRDRIPIMKAAGLAQL